MHRIMAIAVVAAACLATPATACSLSNWNRYLDAREPSLVRLADEAATIDWITVEAGPVRCPYPARLREQPDLVVETGFSCPSHVRAPGNFGGRVLERLKGASDDRFPLVRWERGRWDGFTDPREGLSARAEAQVVEDRRRAASHAEPAFWDSGALPFAVDGSDSCGGQATLSPDSRYVVFRDAAGSVTALEPVFDDGDRLLQRLRARRADPGAPLKDPFPLEAFFRDARGLVLTRVDFCRGGGESYESERARLTTVRGSPAFILDRQWSVSSSDGPTDYEHGAPGSTSFRFDDLWDAFSWRGERCPGRGERVLIVRPSFGADDYGLHRPVRVAADGTVKVADIFTALDLTGPETVTVDQLFAWFEAGRAGRP